VSLPITCAQTIITDSHITGFHLARHDGTARLRRGKLDFADPASGTAPEPRMSFAILKQTDRNRFQVAAHLQTDRVFSALRFKVVFAS